jgi:hypothetical protein
MEVAGFVIFINVLLLIARGWTITTNKLSRKSENIFISGKHTTRLGINLVFFLHNRKYDVRCTKTTDVP